MGHEFFWRMTEVLVKVEAAEEVRTLNGEEALLAPPLSDHAERNRT
jgi:hypothetical protein